MRLRINGFENELVLEESKIGIIEINDIKCFRHILEIINEKINGIENNEIFIFDKDDGEISFSKEVYILFDKFNIDFSNKKIVSKIYSLLENNMIQDEEIELNTKINSLRNILIRHSNELPFNFIMKNEFSLSELLKVFDFKIDEKGYITLLEKLELLIDVLATLKLSKFLIVPDLKNYLTDEELVYLYKYSLYNDIKLILIERKCDKKLKYEKIFHIDENFNDYIE